MKTVIGVDVGQRRDPTALCVVELERRTVADRETVHFLVRHLDRLPLGTPYPAVADRVARVSAGVRARSGAAPELYLDATGVGQPVVDLLKERMNGEWVTPVYFTFGDRRTVEGAGVRLGKAFLVSRLQALLQTGRIHLPSTSEARVLAQELLNYELQVDENANERYGAFKVGTHDDLVTALGLAVQVDQTVPMIRITW